MRRRITVARERGLYGRLRALQIVLDGRDVARLHQDEEVIVELPDGAAQLWGRMDWGRTEPVDVAPLTDGQRVTFKGVFSLQLRRGLGLRPLPFRITVG